MKKNVAIVNGVNNLNNFLKKKKVVIIKNNKDENPMNFHRSF